MFEFKREHRHVAHQQVAQHGGQAHREPRTNGILSRSDQVSRSGDQQGRSGRRQADELRRLVFVDIEFRQPERREGRQHEHGIPPQPLAPRGIIHVQQYGGRCHSETDAVGQRIEFLTQRRVTFQQPCGKAVEEVEHGGRHDQHQRPEQVAVAQRRHRRPGSAEQVTQGQDIGKCKQFDFHSESFKRFTPVGRQAPDFPRRPSRSGVCARRGRSPAKL